MIYLWPIISVFGLLLAISASPTPSNEAASEFTYKGPITPRGEDVTLFGTVENIHEQIRSRNPLFNPIDFEILHEAKLEARTSTGVHCNTTDIPTFWGPAYAKNLQLGVDYINTLPGSCVVPGNGLIRISCINSAAIFVVNQNSNSISIPCRDIAALAKDIISKCSYGGSDPLVNGREGDDAGYYVNDGSMEC